MKLIYNVCLQLNCNIVMNPNRQKQGPPRNITPNFLRFKRTGQVKTGKSTGKKQTSQQPRQEIRNSQRSSSKASKCSFQVYQKRILNLSKLKNTLNIQRKNLEETSVDPSKKKNQGETSSRRTNSNDKEIEDLERENLLAGLRGNQRLLERKRSTGSGKVLKPSSRDKLSNPKRTEQSLDKEEQRAKLLNAELINNLMHHQHVPNYMNKLKIKKNQTYEKKKLVKRKFINCNVEIKGEEEMKNYQFFGQLGKGAYGVVRMGLNRRNGEKVAIKVYEKKRLDQANKIKNLQRQVDILSSLDHPVIAKLLQTIQTQNQIYLIMQYGGANSLYNYLLSKHQHRLDQFQAKKFFRIIAQTLNYLHARNIVHRDIKAQNILLNRHQQLKLIDFGFSLQSKSPNTIDTFCGTPTYMAPEIVSKKDHVPIYTDMWSMGILFYVMLQGNYPFRAKNQNELFQKIKRGHFQYIHDDISQKSKYLIQSLLRVNPLQRLTVQQLLRKQLLEWYSSK